MVKTIYLNIEDDVQTIVQKVARMDAPEVVLVFPKRSYVFSDAINLRLLKKQTDLLGKDVYVLTMDEVGQIYASEAGFQLKSLTRVKKSGLSDIQNRKNSYSNDNEVKENVKVKQVTEYQLPVRKSEIKPISEPVRRIESTPIYRHSRNQPHVVTSEAKYPDKVSVGVVKKIKSKERPKRSTWKITLGFLLPILLILGLVGLFVLPEGKIIVYPKVDNIIRDLEVTAGVGISDVDTSKMLLPATKVNKTLSLQDTFQSSGKKEVGTKASGKVRIINLTGKPISLRANTTVISLGNKNYQFLEDQNNIKAIPAQSLQSGKYAPYIVDVVATDGGEDFNIPAGTRLEITNQVFGSQPQVLYAKTESAILGGTSRFISVVSENDYKNAQNTLVQKMVEQIRSDLASENLKLSDGAYEVNVVDFVSDRPVGTESPSFSVSVKATIKGLVINQSNLNSLVENRIVKSLPEDQKLVNSLSGSLEIKAKNLNNDSGLVVLEVHVEGKSSAQIKLDGIEQELLGKTKQEVSDILLKRPEIEKIDVILSPYWQRTMPKFTTKVKLEFAN